MDHIVAQLFSFVLCIVCKRNKNSNNNNKIKNQIKLY
jgi:hypothetical protein